MARYRAKLPLFVDRDVPAGEIFESDHVPGRNWEPLDAEARRRYAERFPSPSAPAAPSVPAKVLEASDRLDRRPAAPEAVEIAEDWQGLSKAKRRGLAHKLGAPNTCTTEEADAFIAAELKRRADAAK